MIDWEGSAHVDLATPAEVPAEAPAEVESEAEAPGPIDAGDALPDGTAGVRDAAPEAPGATAPDEPLTLPDGDGFDPGDDAEGPWAQTGEADAPEPELEDGDDVAANDFRIVGAPTISLDTFAKVLRKADSPAAGEAAGMYSAAVKYGVDPAVLLAIMKKESGFGRLGIAVGRQNGWGLRWYSSYADLGGTNKGGWARFDSWTTGAKAASRLLASGLYGKSGKYNTARRFPFRWAPASDGNAPRKYGAQIVDFIRSWGGVPGVTTGAIGTGKAATGLGGTGAKAKASKVSKAKAKPSTGEAAATGAAGALPADWSGVIIVGAAALVLLVLVLALRGRRGSED